MPPTLAEKTDLVSIHEERIQRLEDGVAGVRTDVALVDVKVETLETTIKEGMKEIAEQMREMANAFKEHAAENVETANTVDGIVTRITNYEEQRRVRRERWASWGKGTWAIVGGAIAVVIKEAAVALYKAKFGH